MDILFPLFWLRFHDLRHPFAMILAHLARQVIGPIRIRRVTMLIWAGLDLPVSENFTLIGRYGIKRNIRIGYHRRNSAILQLLPAMVELEMLQVSANF
jgi:hypothetical protein